MYVIISHHEVEFFHILGSCFWRLLKSAVKITMYSQRRSSYRR